MDRASSRLERSSRCRGTRARRRPDDGKVDAGEANNPLGRQSEARRCAAGCVREDHKGTGELLAVRHAWQTMQLTGVPGRSEKKGKRGEAWL